MSEKKKALQKLSSEEHTKTLLQDITEENFKKFQEGLLSRCENIGIIPSEEEKESFTYFTLGQLLSRETSQQEDKELYDKASECYECARELCDLLAFRIFM